MRVLIMSDSHGDDFGLRWLLEECWKLTGPIDAYIHLGDGALDFQRVENFIRTRDPHALTYQVKGNCDMGVDLPEVQEIALGGVKLLATHGHRYQVKSTFTPIDVEAHHRGCAAALFGHTHQAYIEQRRTLLVNPGSARGDTLAMLKIENGTVSAEIMHF